MVIARGFAARQSDAAALKCISPASPIKYHCAAPMDQLRSGCDDPRLCAKPMPVGCGDKLLWLSGELPREKRARLSSSGFERR
jgi:hypothetical protein